MRLAPLALTCLAMLVLPATSFARVDAAPPKAPAGLKAFLLRAEEPAAHQFARTPSFAWLPVAGAIRYEFELATSKRFSGSSIVWSNVKDELEEQPAGTTTPATGSTGSATTPAPAPVAKTVYDVLRAPAVALDIALPWITGSPHALYAHVRAITKSGPTSWSKPYGFNIRWSSVPKDLKSPYAGLVRWSPVEGATAYEVWLLGARNTFMTPTNVADARDLYTFHRNPAWTTAVSYRVRAVRKIYGEVASGLPATTFGPWSPVFTNVQAPLSLGTVLRNGVAISDIAGAAGGAAHALTPGFTFLGDHGGPLDFNGGASAELFRVYVATDEDCVNIVYRSAIVGSPAYAPRLTGPLELPDTDVKLAAARTKALKHGKEPADNFMLDGTIAVTTEQAPAASPGTGSGTGSGSGSGSASGGSSSTTAPVTLATVDLPDTAWPTGGYYWTVVPVIWVPKPDATPSPAGIPIEYRETELPQDACQSGRVQRFGKTSAPVVTSSTRPFASGLSPKGRLISATRKTPSFYGTPLVAWQPALGAQEYEVQWSKTANPWRPVASVKTGATSALLPVGPGSWYYRVRGYNHALPKRPQMAWSDPVALKVTKPTFRVVGK